MKDKDVAKISITAINAKASRMPSGYAGEIIAAATRVDPAHVYLPRAAYESLKEKYRQFNQPEVGTHLKKLLATFGIVASHNCSCNKRARIMNNNGPDWCEANIDTIVGWLREEASKRGLPFLDAVGKLLVRRAIKAARKAAASGKEATGSEGGNQSAV